MSVLSSARREEVRRMQDEAEKLRANPLLYLVSPHVKVGVPDFSCHFISTPVLEALEISLRMVSGIAC